MNNMEKILIIEDEEKIARFVQLELEYEGYQVEKAVNGRDGLDLIKAHSFDLVLLDIMLPGINGIEVLRRIRQFSEIPVIMLTARDNVIDKVSGLDNGADDYITKPFEIEELLARIRVALRKRQKLSASQMSGPINTQMSGAINTQAISSPTINISNIGQAGHLHESRIQTNRLQVGLLQLDIERREVKVNDTLIDLTKREFDLLQYLLENKNIVLHREQLLEQIWGYDFAGGSNAVDVYIRYLRSKIEEPFNLKIIQTVRGVGYVIRDE